MNTTPKTLDLFSRVADLIEQSRQYVAKAMNTAMVATYYEIGRYIIEDEQQGKSRAEYGKRVLQELSNLLTEKFGNGWSVENLKIMRQFYQVYSNSVNTAYPIQRKDFVLPWSHYLTLPEDTNIYATQYSLCLPDKATLQRKLKEWLEEE